MTGDTGQNARCNNNLEKRATNGEEVEICEFDGGQSLLAPKGMAILLSALNFARHLNASSVEELDAPAGKLSDAQDRPSAAADRTFVDRCKHRNHVTLELCVEALRERIKDRRYSLQRMHH